MTPHVSLEAVLAYGSGTLDEPGCWLVESHVEGCPDCAMRVSRACTAPVLRQVRLDMLHRTGARARSPLRLTVVPALRAGWLLAVVTAALSVLLLDALGAGDQPGLLLVAPLLPLLGIAAAGVFEPSLELLESTPTSPLRLLLLRSAGVLAVSVPPLLVASLLSDIDVLLWLLPALALVSLSLALSHWWTIEVATGVAAVLWLFVALGPATLRSAPPLALTSGAAPAWLVLTLASGLLLLALSRRDDATAAPR